MNAVFIISGIIELDSYLSLILSTSVLHNILRLHWYHLLLQCLL